MSADVTGLAVTLFALGLHHVVMRTPRLLVQNGPFYGVILLEVLMAVKSIWTGPPGFEGSDIASKAFAALFALHAGEALVRRNLRLLEADRAEGKPDPRIVELTTRLPGEELPPDEDVPPPSDDVPPAQDDLR